MPGKQKYYVVWKGRQTGVFSTWNECAAQVNGYMGAEYKAFESKTQAQQALQKPYSDFVNVSRVRPPSPRKPEKKVKGEPLEDSYCVDAACSGNPGILEYRCVHTQTRKVIFHKGPFRRGTNNIGEFLAIVHALALLKAEDNPLPVYSDSKIAISWVRQKKCKTNLVQDERNVELFDLIARAEAWLKSNTYTNHVLKWETHEWGENPADFGRK